MKEKAKRVHLTKTVVDSLKYTGKQLGENNYSRCVYWDDSLRGFGVRIFPSGLKTFVLSYRIHGRKRLVTLGEYGKDCTLQEAKDKAQIELGKIRQGQDPLKEKKRKEDKKKEPIRFMDELAKDYIQNYSMIHKKSWSEDKRRSEAHIETRFKRYLIREVTRADITRFHLDIGKDNGHYEANRCLSLLSSMFEYAFDQGYVTEEELSANPCSRVTRFDEKKRNVYMKMDEIPKFLEALEREENVYSRSAIYLYILTGCRKQELLKATWEDVNFETKQLRLLDTKNGKPHFVHLSAPAVDLLKGLPVMEGNPYLFPSLTRRNKHLVEVDRRWRNIRDAAGLDRIHIHDLRRSLGSWLAQEGYSLQLIGRILNHADVKTTAIYAHLTDDPAKQAMEKIGEKVIEIAKLKEQKQEGVA